MRKFIVIISCILVFLAAGVFVIYFGGREVLISGEEDTRWVRVEMWPVVYFNNISGGLSEVDKVYLDSLNISGTDRRHVSDYLAQNKCSDSDESCVSNLLSVVNILIDEGQLAKAKQLLNQAAKELFESKACPIKFEITMLNNVVKVMGAEPIEKAQKRALLTIGLIKKNKGINFNLQSEACNNLAKEKPELFHQYVMSVAEIMSYAPAPLPLSAAYLRKESVNK